MRPEKVAMQEEFREDLGKAIFVILTDYRGLNVAQTQDLRGRLRGVDAGFKVVRNRIFSRVASEFPCKGIGQGLEGPTAMVVSQGDVVQAAKVLKTFIKENDLPVIKIGAMEGVILSPEDIDELASLPSREQLYGKLVGTLAAPMSGLVGVFSQKKASIVYALKAFQEKKS